MTDFDDDFDRMEQELGTIARGITAEDRALADPPIELVEAIRAEVRAADPTGATRRDRPDHDLIAEKPADLAARRERRGASGGWRLIAAAAAIVIVGITAVLVSRQGDSTIVYSSTVTNDGLEVPFDADGTADIVEDGNDLVLELDLPDLPPTDGFYEVWLIDTDVVGMVSLGPAPTDGRIVLPSSVDPGAFPVVDVSVEPVDGVPTHSGQSILRGVLERA